MRRWGSLVMAGLAAALATYSIWHSASASERPVIAVDVPAADASLGAKIDQIGSPARLVRVFETALRNSRRFEVVARQPDALRGVIRERMMDSSGLQLEPQFDLGRMLAARYVVSPYITAFTLERRGHEVPEVAGRFVQQDVGAIGLNIQLIDAQDQVIRLSFQLEGRMETPASISSTPIQGSAPDGSLVDAVLADAAGKFVDHIVDTLYPMTVLDIIDGRVFIDRGADGGLAVGDTLDLFRLGRTLRDAEGRSLGQTELPVGQARVVQVTPRFTALETLSADMKVEVGDRARRPQS